jgi:hypothetical protein
MMKRPGPNDIHRQSESTVFKAPALLILRALRLLAVSDIIPFVNFWWPLAGVREDRKSRKIRIVGDIDSKTRRREHHNTRYCYARFLLVALDLRIQLDYLYLILFTFGIVKIDVFMLTKVLKLNLPPK